MPLAQLNGRQALVQPIITVDFKQAPYVERLLAEAPVFAAQPAAAAWRVARERDTTRADAQMAKARTVVPVMVTDHLQVVAFYNQPAVIWIEIDWLPHLLAVPEVPLPRPLDARLPTLNSGPADPDSQPPSRHLHMRNGLRS